MRILLNSFRGIIKFWCDIWCITSIINLWLIVRVAIILTFIYSRSPHTPQLHNFFVPSDICGSHIITFLMIFEGNLSTLHKHSNMSLRKEGNITMNKYSEIGSPFLQCYRWQCYRCNRWPRCERHLYFDRDICLCNGNFAHQITLDKWLPLPPNHLKHLTIKHARRNYIGDNTRKRQLCCGIIERCMPAPYFIHHNHAGATHHRGIVLTRSHSRRIGRTDAIHIATVNLVFCCTQIFIEEFGHFCQDFDKVFIGGVTRRIYFRGSAIDAIGVCNRCFFIIK